jgi:uncharacterized membrane protein
MAENGGPGDKMPEKNTTSSGMEPNVAGLLCYLFTWVTGIIFLVIEKENRFVRFHAIQAIGVGVAWTAAWIVLSILVAIFSGGFATFINTVGSLALGLGGLVLWVLLMYKAYQGEMWQLPYIGPIAKRESDKLKA